MGLVVEVDVEVVVRWVKRVRKCGTISMFLRGDNCAGVKYCSSLPRTMSLDDRVVAGVVVVVVVAVVAVFLVAQWSIASLSWASLLA